MDDEAYHLYEKFVKFFKADDVPGGKEFVIEETIDPNEHLKTRLLPQKNPKYLTYK